MYTIDGDLLLERTSSHSGWSAGGADHRDSVHDIERRRLPTQPVPSAGRKFDVIINHIFIY